MTTVVTRRCGDGDWPASTRARRIEDADDSKQRESTRACPTRAVSGEFRREGPPGDCQRQVRSPSGEVLVVGLLGPPRAQVAVARTLRGYAGVDRE